MKFDLWEKNAELEAKDDSKRSSYPYTQSSSNKAQLIRGQKIPRSKMKFDNFDVEEAAPVMASAEETTSAA